MYKCKYCGENYVTKNSLIIHATLLCEKNRGILAKDLKEFIKTVEPE